MCSCCRCRSKSMLSAVIIVKDPWLNIQLLRACMKEMNAAHMLINLAHNT